MVRTKRPRRHRRTSDPFPIEQFRQLLIRYCREHFTAKKIAEHASYGKAYIGVCIGDDAGSLNRPVIECGVGAALAAQEVANAGK